MGDATKYISHWELNKTFVGILQSNSIPMTICHSLSFRRPSVSESTSLNKKAKEKSSVNRLQQEHLLLLLLTLLIINRIVEMNYSLKIKFSVNDRVVRQ